jgi:hypothetical protein
MHAARRAHKPPHALTHTLIHHPHTHTHTHTYTQSLATNESAGTLEALEQKLRHYEQVILRSFSFFFFSPLSHIHAHLRRWSRSCDTMNRLACSLFPFFLFVYPPTLSLIHAHLRHRSRSCDTVSRCSRTQASLSLSFSLSLSRFRSFSLSLCLPHTHTHLRRWMAKAATLLTS